MSRLLFVLYNVRQGGYWSSETPLLFTGPWKRKVWIHFTAELIFNLQQNVYTCGCGWLLRHKTGLDRSVDIFRVSVTPSANKVSWTEWLLLSVCSSTCIDTWRLLSVRKDVDDLLRKKLFALLPFISTGRYTREHVSGPKAWCLWCLNESLVMSPVVVVNEWMLIPTFTSVCTCARRQLETSVPAEAYSDVGGFLLRVWWM
jgi:hypothetical protein